MVLQDNFLFSATVRENIALGRPSAPPEEIEKAAELAQALEFISELPRKFETPVGERGIGLSGGQKQRVSLARALLMDRKTWKALQLERRKSRVMSEYDLDLRKTKKNDRLTEAFDGDLGLPARGSTAEKP